MNILLDTNFLIYCAKQKIDYLREIERLFPKYEVIVPSSVIGELESLLRREKGKSAATIKLVLALIENSVKKGNLKEIKTENHIADEALVEFDKKDNIIATVDKELKERFKNAKILTIRQKRYLFLN
jgi:rRNA-processing protein FCF1